VVNHLQASIKWTAI